MVRVETGYHDWFVKVVFLQHLSQTHPRHTDSVANDGNSMGVTTPPRREHTEEREASNTSTGGEQPPRTNSHSSSPHPASPLPVPPADVQVSWDMMDTHTHTHTMNPYLSPTHTHTPTHPHTHTHTLSSTNTFIVGHRVLDQKRPAGGWKDHNGSSCASKAEMDGR